MSVRKGSVIISGVVADAANQSLNNLNAAGQAVINAKANDSNTVHKTGNETIEGTKTLNNYNLVVKCTTADDEASSISANTEKGILINDKNGSRIGNFYGGQLSNGKLRTYMCACRPVNGSTVYKYAEIQQNTDGTAHFNISCDTTQAPTPAVSDNSTKIATTAYFNNKMQVVSSLPSSPTAGVFYFVKE